MKVVEDSPQRIVLDTSGSDRVVGILIFIAGAFVMLSGIDLWFELQLGIAITEDMPPLIGVFMGSLFALFGIALITKEEHLEVDFVKQQIMGGFRYDKDANEQPILFSEIRGLVIETQQHMAKGGYTYTYHLHANEVKDENTIMIDSAPELVEMVARRLVDVTRATVTRVGTNPEE